MRAPIRCFVGMALGLLLITPPAFAMDEQKDDAAASSFHALESVMAQNDQKPLNPFSDDRLASIEGEGYCFGCPSINVRINVSPITQFNLINQFNFAIGRDIFQENHAFGGNTARFLRYRFHDR